MRDTFLRSMLWTGQRAMKCWTKAAARGVALATLVVATTLAPTVARADADRVRFLADKLKSDDFRVRTNAALALGAANDDLAVEPLCGALGDSSEVVRQASAVAMKRLARPQALGCLKDRASRETDESVKTAIARAIESLPPGTGTGGGGAGDDAIKNNPSAKYYIAISSIANSTARSQPEVEAVVMKAIKAKLEAAGTVQIAPAKEAADSARDTMKKRKLNGFYLAIAVDRFDYSNGNLRVKVKIGVFTYPGKSLLGNVDKALTKEGVSNGDKSSEDQLLDLAAGLASEQFAQNASAFL